jgi:endonuclease/exonuclease/phosphatase family metal-dependent hydrolase
MRLRVLTLNVQNDEGDSRRTGLINRELRRLALDLVAFQEVCYPDRRDQLAELVDGTGLMQHDPPGRSTRLHTALRRPLRRDRRRDPVAASRRRGPRPSSGGCV